VSVGSELKRTAIIYDFDGTLAKGNLQERSFIPQVGMSVAEFWGEVKTRKEQEDADEILVYMHLMLEKARLAGLDVTKEALRQHGADAPLFRGWREKFGLSASMPLPPSRDWRWSTTFSRRGSRR
jgi:hypothetical protein